MKTVLIMFIITGLLIGFTVQAMERAENKAKRKGQHEDADRDGIQIRFEFSHSDEEQKSDSSGDEQEIDFQKKKPIRLLKEARTNWKLKKKTQDRIKKNNINK